MRKEDARQLVSQLVNAQSSLSRAVEHVEGLPETEATASLRKTIANAIGDIAADALAPILQLYPDLDPYDEEEMK